ncbi:hypothetical protein [Saliterribacillus persicus]|uniref:Uncharacterized protein n=1 Tax=Saliterribacillus persicus TaxID=930114 RepID=A0A368YAV1_9BACI|nr:hypothetical protein [Saliterribacillus persicus]RCW77391.1 hypothetical protein DFR57_101264 [Saliterribacillus persicus]
MLKVATKEQQQLYYILTSIQEKESKGESFDDIMENLKSELPKIMEKKLI